MLTTRAVGWFVSPDTCLTFVEGDERNVLQAIENQNEAKPLRVELPLSQYLCRSALSAAEKVGRVLRNCHWRPYKQTDGVVRFGACGTVNGWEPFAGKVIQHQGGSTFWFPRRDGTISYVCENTVMTWDWRSGKCTPRLFNTNEITAMAELPDGTLVVGDNKGALHFEEQMVQTEAKSINQIRVISSEEVIVFGRDALLVNLKTSTTSPIRELNNNSRLLVDGTILELKEGKIVKCHQNVATETDLCGTQIVPIANSATQVVVTGAEPTKVIIWDVHSDTRCEIEAEPLGRLSESKKVFLIDKETLAFDDQNVGSALIHLCSKGRQPVQIKCDQFSKIRDMCLLSNNTFLCVSPNCEDGHVFIVDRKSTIAWQTDASYLDNSNPTELADGSVAYLCGTRLQVIKPNFKQSSTEIDLMSLEKEIKDFPHQLELYERYVSHFSNSGNRSFNPKLAAMIASIRAGNIYAARRYYERVKITYQEHVDKNTKTAATIFLRYLQFFAEPKLTRQIQLDLHRLIPDAIELPPNDKLKKRLLVGEGGFTYTEALINKHEGSHPTLAQAITATELNVPKDPKVLERCESLRQKGVKVLFGVDGKLLHHHFPGHRFERIQWNCPFGNGGDRDNGFEKVIPQFFLSASQLQMVGDRIHVTLMDLDKSQIENPIVYGASQAGYRLIRKRPFGSERYLEYEHVKTDTNSRSNQAYNEGGKEKEFVFEKTEIGKKEGPTREDAERLVDPNVKKYKVVPDGQPDLKKCRYECSEDGDSSDYWV